MEFDTVSYLLGMITVVAVSLIYVGIVESLERRRQWEQVMYNSSSPSREYWGKVLEEIPTDPMESDPIKDELIRVIPSQSEPEQ